MADQLVFAPAEVMRQMADDLRIVADVSAERIQRLRGLLEQQSGFLADEQLAAMVGACVESEAEGQAIFSALHNLRASSVGQVLESLDAWRQSQESNRQRFPDEAFAALRGKLSDLVRDYPALNRTKKAARLKGALGHEYEGIVFICDARPIYNETRDRIEGMIPLTTMKLVFERQSGESDQIEVVLTRQQLEELLAKARQAEQKLSVLRHSISEWIPDGCFEGEE